MAVARTKGKWRKNNKKKKVKQISKRKYERWK